MLPTTNRKIMRAHGEDLNVNCQGNGETAYDAVFAMASLSLGQDRYDFSLSARATAAFLGRLCQCACFQVGCLRKTDGTRDKGERKSHGEGEEQLMLLGATRSTRFLCAKRDKHDAISLGVQSQEISLVYHTSFPHFLLVTPSLLYFQYGLLLLRMRCRTFPLHL